MKVVIIGSGNVATHLGKALHAAKFSITQVWSQQYENALGLAEAIEAKAIADLSSLDTGADLLIISIKDDAISSIIDQLKEFRGIVVHTSGATGIDVFADQFETYGVFYPLQTFSKTKEVKFENIPICIEASNLDTFEQLHKIASRLSVNIQQVSSEKRKILHLAAVFACNFPNYLYTVADEILTKHGLSFDILRPLVLETALKVQEALPSAVQTGPAKRNDKLTLEQHLLLLANEPQHAELYKTLSERIKKTR